MDTIFIEGLTVLAHVGVTRQERSRRQRLSIDLELTLPLARAGRSDSVEDTIDYAAVSLEAKRIAQGHPFSLAEAIAEAVAGMLLERFHPQEVRVRVKKFSVPKARCVGVEIRRSRKRSHERLVAESVQAFR